MKIVINTCYGGFSLSDKAYERLIELGIPVRKYKSEPLNPKTGKYDIAVPENEGEVIFDRTLTPKGEDKLNDIHYQHPDLVDRYWESWIGRNNRTHPLLVQVVEELDKEANTRSSKLKVIDIPDDIEYTIEDYDGLEHIAENHRTWS